MVDWRYQVRRLSVSPKSRLFEERHATHLCVDDLQPARALPRLTARRRPRARARWPASTVRSRCADERDERRAEEHLDEPGWALVLGVDAAEGLAVDDRVAFPGADGQTTADGYRREKQVGRRGWRRGRRRRRGGRRSADASRGIGSIYGRAGSE